MSEKMVSWGDYLYIGLVLAIMMAVRGEFQDGFPQMILFALFFVLTGLAGNLKTLNGFITSFPVFAIFTAAWTIYFKFVSVGDRVSYRYAITAFFLVFAGYCISHEQEEAIKRAMGWMWMVLFIAEALDVANYVIVHDFETRMYLLFNNPIAEGDASIILTLISLFYIDKVWKKVAGILLSVVVVVLGSLRMASAVLVLLIISYLVWKRREIAEKIGIKSALSSKRRILYYAVAAMLIIILGVGVLFASRAAGGSFSKLFGRYLSAFSAVTRDVYLNYYGDISLKIRVMAIDQALNSYRRGSIFDHLLGHGLLSGYYAIKPTMTLLTMAEDEAAGPIENAFIALLSDYGALSLVLYLSVYVSAISSMVKSKLKSVKISSIFVVVIMTLSAFIDMEYWINLIFFVWLFVGIYLGHLIKAEEKHFLLPAMIFSTFVSVNLFFLPACYSLIRTLMNSLTAQLGKACAIVLLVLLFGLYVFLLWNLCKLLSLVIMRGQQSVVMRPTVIVTAAIGLLMSVLLIVGAVSIKRSELALKECLDSEKEIVEVVRNNANGSVYNDTYPLIYNKYFGNIKGTLFAGACLAPYENTTVIVSREEEQYLLSKTGFVYLPISGKDAIYTNDDGVIRALNEKGYNLTGYNTEVRELSDQNSQKADLYPGEYTAVYKLKLGENGLAPDNQVCRLVINSDEVETPYADVLIMRSQFDDNGELEYAIPFYCYAKDCNFTVSAENDDIESVLSVEYITYKRTPSVDTRVKVNNEGRIIREDYYDLDGQLMLTAEGYCSMDISYDDAGEVAGRIFYDLNGNVVKEE